MAIQNRRGAYGRLDTEKLLPGEYAVVLRDDPFCKDGQSVYICFNAGNTKRMATYEDMKENIEKAAHEIISVMEKVTEEGKAAVIDAKAVTGDLVARRESGEFNGPPGANGVVMTTQGQYGFQIKSDDLYLYYHDGDVPPECSIDDEGNLIMNIGGNV